MHTDDSHRINFKKPGVRRPRPARAWFKNDLRLYCSLALVINIDICDLVTFCLNTVGYNYVCTATFNKLQFYIIERHKGNKNMYICIILYGKHVFLVPLANK